MPQSAMPDMESQKDDDGLKLEGKLKDRGPSSLLYERTISTRKKSLSLLGYFVCNVGLTLYNKAVLGKV